ncbi:hypothetical protein D9M69_387430 [compost metagenome]
MFLAGLAQEGEDRRQHQDGLQAFTQQDQQAGDKAQRTAQAIGTEQLGGLVQLHLGLLQQLRRLGHRLTVLQRLPIGHQGALGGLALHGIEVVERAFHQLETFQVGRHREVVGLVRIAIAVGLEALLQGGAGVADQLLGPALLQRRLGTLGAEQGLGRGTLAGTDLLGRAPGQLTQWHGLALHRRVGAEAGDVAGQVPALAVVELVGEGRHVGAFDAEAQGVVEVVEAEPVHPRLVAQVGGRRLEAHARRTVAGAGIAMADAAMLGIERRATGRVGGDDRCLADLIGRRQLGGQLACLARHVDATLVRLDGLAQGGDALLQVLLAITGRQGDDQALQHTEEFDLFAVFAGVDDLAIDHGGRVVGANVTEQVQGLGGPFGLVGHQAEAAERHQRHQQPAEQSRNGQHESISNENGEWNCYLPNDSAQPQTCELFAQPGRGSAAAARQRALTAPARRPLEGYFDRKDSGERTLAGR